MELPGRLSRFREEGREPLAPLWIEALPPEEALEELRGREGAVFRIQEARFLGMLGRVGEAQAVLGGLGELPAGLGRLREAVARELGPDATEAQAAPEDETPPMASKTLAEIHARQGDVEGAVAIYREVLARDPDDVEARERLRQLLGTAEEPPPSGAAGRLAEWLERVRAWRRVLGV
ncbi:tetratricopeptide repeat protein [Deferrisoma camini]|uniref:tetratricopeptide repeat protein n=1 Tax=Deferrisoma camini TaxID=1035120 RepID=UPI00046CD679|nr:tetratricopeptide repeat protein [Deferrisoma camini]